MWSKWLKKVLGVLKNCQIERVLLSTLNICFGSQHSLRIRINRGSYISAHVLSLFRNKCNIFNKLLNELRKRDKI